MKILSTVAAGLFVLTLAANASAVTQTFVGGEICVPSTSADQPFVVYGQYGVNSSQTNQSLLTSVKCSPSLQTQGLSVQRVVVSGYSRNASTTLVCNVYVESADGNIIQSSQLVFGGPSASVIQRTANFTAQGTVHLDCAIPPIANSGAFNGWASHVSQITVIEQ